MISELVCPAGSVPALKAAVHNGADCVYLGFRDATNARNFAGLNVDDQAIGQGIVYPRARHCKVLVALNTYPQAGNWQAWRDAPGQRHGAGAGHLRPSFHARPARWRDLQSQDKNERERKDV
jgi:collagenase-like PrtC family protease